jgi:murein DD-endopeptidase MepM/ murein hydrolase activator NlpD
MLSLKNIFRQDKFKKAFALFAGLCLFLIMIPGISSKKEHNRDSIHKVSHTGSNAGGGSIYVSDSLSDVLPETLPEIFSEVLSNDLHDNYLLELPAASVSPEISALEPDLFSGTRFLFYNSHIVQRGDNISTLAIIFGLHQGTLISVNKITNARLLQIGHILKIPNQDGILHDVKTGDTLDSISETYKTEPDAIRIANELFSDNIRAGTSLFIPGARLDWASIQEISGDLFIWPINGLVTSSYGYRRSPFNPTRREFHTGIDIKGNTGTPVRAAMAGRVSGIGNNNVLGNYIIIDHHSGYRTLYAHLSVIRTRGNAYVGTGERIGDVGSTGQSTGPHLHFAVYKNGITVNPRSLIR